MWGNECGWEGGWGMLGSVGVAVCVYGSARGSMGAHMWWDVHVGLSLRTQTHTHAHALSFPPSLDIHCPSLTALSVSLSPSFITQTHAHTPRHAHTPPFCFWALCCKGPAVQPGATWWWEDRKVGKWQLQVGASSSRLTGALEPGWLPLLPAGTTQPASIEALLTCILCSCCSDLGPCWPRPRIPATPLRAPTELLHVRLLPLPPTCHHFPHFPVAMALWHYMVSVCST